MQFLPSRVSQFNGAESHTNKQLQYSVKNATAEACPKYRSSLEQDVVNPKGGYGVGGTPVEGGFI